MRPAFTIPLLAIALLGCSERVQLPPCPGAATTGWEADHGVAYHTELQVAMRCSRETGRPILVLFDAYAQSYRACWEVLGNRAVQTLIRDRLVLCVLMVDDRKTLGPEDTIGFPLISRRRIPTTIGQRNILLEMAHFKRSSQPLFTLVDADFSPLTEPMGYVPGKKPELLVAWLEGALGK